MNDAEAKRAYLCLVTGRAMIGVFSPIYAARLGAVPALDIFGQVVPITHAATIGTDIGRVAEGGEEIVGLVDKDSVSQLTYAIAVVTPASTVYRGFVHFHTVPVSSEKVSPPSSDSTATQDGS